MDIVILTQARKELKVTPKEVLSDAFALFDRLAGGVKLSMPVSRPLSNLAKGLHELRLPHADGTYRVFYIIKQGDAIYILHSLKKKTQQLNKKTKQLILSRIRSIKK